MAWDGMFTLVVIGAVLFVLVRNLAPPDVTMISGAVALGVAGVLKTPEVFAGFVSSGVLTITALFVVAAAVRETGILDHVSARILGRARTERGAMARLALTVVPMSAFLNNTPVVAMLVPTVTQWCRRNNIAPSRLLIPLSYFAILGGLCTLIGTSTIIVINGLMQDEYARCAGQAEAPAAMVTGLASLGMFEVTLLGLPFALVGTAYLLLAGHRLLPGRTNPMERHGEDPRAYLIDLQVQSNCRLAGKNIAEAGLRHLPGLFLVEIVRQGRSITPVSPNEVLETNDILTFTGVVDTIIDIERIPGLTPLADNGYVEKDEERRDAELCEAVISASSPLLGKTVRDADFRALYNAAIIAVHRSGQRVGGRVGDIVLREGDTLLLQAGPHFVRAHRNNRDFYLVSGVEESRALRNDKAALAGGLLVLLVVLLSAGPAFGVSIPVAAVLIAMLMIATQCISPALARESVDWRTVLTIGGAIGLGRALEKTGAAGQIAGYLVNMVGALGPLWALAILYIATSLITECITTQGAAVLMFPLAVATAGQFAVSPRPFVMAVLFAAAASFMSPLGYQTNLMVYGPGGYKYTDFMRIGVPLNIILVVLALVFIPLIWPL